MGEWSSDEDRDKTNRTAEYTKASISSLAESGNDAYIRRDEERVGSNEAGQKKPIVARRTEDTSFRCDSRILWLLDDVTGLQEHDGWLERSEGFGLTIPVLTSSTTSIIRPRNRKVHARPHIATSLRIAYSMSSASPSKQTAHN
jgi:hypothetical protein